VVVPLTWDSPEAAAEFRNRLIREIELLRDHVLELRKPKSQRKGGPLTEGELTLIEILCNEAIRQGRGKS
jgi:hypothetical protein